MVRPGSLPEPAGVRWWPAGRVRGRALEPVLLVLVELGGRGAAFSTLPGRRSGAIRDFPGGHLVCPALCGDRAHPAAPSPTLCGRTGFSRCISRRVPSLRQCRRCWVLATTHWPQGPGCEGGRGADTRLSHCGDFPFSLLPDDLFGPCHCLSKMPDIRNVLHHLKSLLWKLVFG